MTLVTSDGAEEIAAAGVLVESPATAEGSDLLQAARIVGAVAMLRRAGFDLRLLPPGATVLKSRRRCWRRR